MERGQERFIFRDGKRFPNTIRVERRARNGKREDAGLCGSKRAGADEDLIPRIRNRETVHEVKHKAHILRRDIAEVSIRILVDGVVHLLRHERLRLILPGYRGETLLVSAFIQHKGKRERFAFGAVRYGFKQADVPITACEGGFKIHARGRRCFPRNAVGKRKAFRAHALGQLLLIE